MNVHILGAGQDVGRSCLLVTIENRNLLLDCGAHHGFSDARRFPDFSSIPVHILSNLDAVLISHFHFDHVAALPLLDNVTKPHQPPIYMTEPTLHLSRLLLHDVCATSVSRKQICPFTDADVDICLDGVQILRPNECTAIGRRSDLFVTPFLAGHTLGAVMFHIRVAKRTVLYTGDFSVRSDRYLHPAQLPFALKPDLLISEATYCLSNRTQSNLEQNRLLMNAVIDTLSHRGKILIPISAFGRVHTICSIFTAYANNYPLHEVPMYVVSGLATRANEVYDRFSIPEWTVHSSKTPCIHCSVTASRITNKRSRFGNACTHTFAANLRPFNRNDHWESVVLSKGPVILFATPGTLATGLSLDVFRIWSSDPKNLVIMPGTSFAHTIASNLVHSPSFQNAPDSEQAPPNVRCKMFNLNVNCHADGKDIKRICNHIDPKSIVLVHGEKSKVLTFRQQLHDMFSIPCFAPANGETIHIPENVYIDTTPIGVDTNTKNNLADEWQRLLYQYDGLLEEQNSAGLQQNITHGP